MGKLLTKEECNKRLKTKNSKLRIIGEFLGKDIPVLVGCENGHEYVTTYTNLRKNVLKECKICLKESKKISKARCQEILDNDNRGYIILDDFNILSDYSNFMCPEKHIWNTIINNVVHLKTNCPICSSLSNRHPLNYYILKLEQQNRGIYFYLGENENINDYVYSHDKHIFICENNHMSNSSISQVVNSGMGCKQCATESMKHSCEIINNKLKENCNAIEFLGPYINNGTPGLCRCLVCNYEWEPTPNNILSGCGCPKCAKYGFDPSEPAIYYYIKLKDYELYKGGITNNTVKKRFPGDYKLMEELFIIPFEFGKNAYEFEQHILKEFSEYKYTGLDILKSGNTEIFTKNILEDLVKYL